MPMSVVEIKDKFLELQKKYRQYLPKVDPALIDDLLLRNMENPNVVQMYLVEVFTKPGLNTEEVRSYIIGKTGMSPAIYDNGTHYVTNQKLTLEMLKEISDSEEVIEVTGEFTGGLGSYGASHEHRPRQERHAETSASSPAGTPQVKARAAKEEPVMRIEGSRNVIYAAVGIIGAIALAGFIISGGHLPNTTPSQAVPAGAEPGILHGYVAGPGGLPAIGASVLAVQQGTPFAASAFVSVNGQYSLDLPPGNYIVVVAYPDGAEKMVSLDVGRGTNHELDFAY